MDVKGKRMLIIGAGKSGVSAAVLLKKAGADPVIYDSSVKLDIQGTIDKIDERLDPADRGSVGVFIGVPDEERFADVLVLSPGVPTDTEFVADFKSRGIPVWGEVELGYLFAKGRVIAITGTNGKTTTTSLVGKIVKDWYEKENKPGKVYVAGNIGDPYTDIALDTKEEDTTVLEISSFQLETTDAFHPEVSAILNITPDHLNRHHTMKNYAACKGRISLRQNADEWCVLNADDEWLPEMAGKMNCKSFFFSYTKKLKDGIYVEGKDIIVSEGGVPQKVMSTDEMKLLGAHNVENVMAAIAMCLKFGIPADDIVQSVREFGSVEHRIEYTATVKGVDYYNDSKGTNPDAAIKAVRAMVKPTVLIGGGYDKQNEYDEWIESFGSKVKALILLGQTADKIEACARKHGFQNIIRAESMEDAVAKAYETAVSGDAVLLSPACASWGMFKNFEERGRIFKEAVRGLKG
ncbi:MAG: UDP-N-acetylmuramoyl-L-alanine--D-glutamate ligase [Lachnospiraceae bacterium]|nr:UDP-N-acetylmuramoyl-L-alanine--D-glutamate ligase [Lachnospiraceae bacterium]